MTFKIDKVGFYKNRGGEKIQIRQLTGQGWYADDGWFYEAFGANTLYNATPDIIAHWEEPIEQFVQEYEASDKGWKGEPLELKDFAHETDCESETKFYIVLGNTQEEPYGMYETLEVAKSSAQSAAKEYLGETFHVMQTVAAYTAEVEIKEVKI